MNKKRSRNVCDHVPLLLAALTFSILLQSPTLAAGDPSAGEILAKEHCARCHDVAAGGAFKTFPPSFASIAAYRSEEQIYARIIFPQVHSAMPNVALYLLEPQQITDLVAYIMSLEKKAP